MQKFRLFFVLLACTLSANAQTLTQTLRGTVSDKFSNSSIADAMVIIIGDDADTVISNKDGTFETITTVGKKNISIIHPDYMPTTVSEVLVTSGKQTVLTIGLQQKVSSKKTELATITARRRTTRPINEMSLVSTRQFVTEDAARYAGSLGDPARMARNYAGVQSNGDSRNDIIIRGNSPLGVGWRLEGIDIPNPNHFSGVGTTGGAISILNNNNLANSDFLTGAFAPMYGNAIAGFFDLRLRNGNNKQFEYLGQMGFNGAELGAEGPLSKNSKSSFIINARYSTLELFQALNINLGAQAQPRYRDLTFKINMPDTKVGTVSFWGVGGYNRSISLSKNYDTTGRGLNPRPKGFDTYFDNSMYVVGVTQNKTLRKNLTCTNIFSLSNSSNQTRVDSLYNNDTEKFIWLGRDFSDTRLSTHHMLAYKANAQHQTQIGVYLTYMIYDVKDSIYSGAYKRYFSLLSFNGNTLLARSYVQHQYNITNNTVIVAGLHGMHYNFSKRSALEPRIALRHQINSKLSTNIGLGVHNQLQPLTTYFYNRSGLGNFKDTLTNRYLDFIKSNHVVVGLDFVPKPQHRIKLDMYVQQISGAAVERDSSTYSTLNEGAFYYMIPKPLNVNKGTGFNQGIELTLEKFFSKQYYYLITATLYKSTYVPSNGATLPTAFDGRWSTTALGGYEWKINKNHLLSVNLKLAAQGGRPYTLVDTLASNLAQQTILDERTAFMQRYPTYFRPDIRIAYRLNNKRASHEFGINVDNFINRLNVQSIEYDNYRKVVGYSYQMGRLPVLQYKIEWH